ncbi:MAG: T9SS type A sorting domain-containing protein [Chitinophagales bacterium]|nr:T9SS type A sorting domain-containing protein [Chitinophagales bacterium]
MKSILTFLSHKILNISWLFIIMYSGETAQAQWSQTSGPQGINVNVFFDNGIYLFAGTSAKGVFRSADHGATWAAANDGLENAIVYSFAQDQTNLYAGTQSGVYRSANNGSTWTAANTGIQNQSVYEMTIGGGYLFAGTIGFGVFKSSNQGGSWTNANGGALDQSFILAMCYVNNRLIVEADNYIFYSTNAGNTWFVDQGSTAFYPIDNFLVIGDTIVASAYGGVFHSYNGGVSWSRFLQVNPVFSIDGLAYSNGIVYAGSQDGMYRSTDFALTWQKIPETGLRIGSRFYNHFIQSGNIFLLGMDELGIYTSADGGSTWNPSISGFPGASTIDDCMIDIGDNIWTGTHSDGVYKTGNNGKSWKKKGTTNNNDSLSNGIVFCMLNPAPDIILAGTCGFGLYRSANNGKSWKHILNGLPFSSNNNYECDFSLTMSGTNVLIATDQGLFYSSDNGKTWQSTNISGSGFIVEGLGANGSVAVAGVDQIVSPFQSGLYRSTNSGVTWTFIGGILDVITIESDNVNTFYAGTLFNSYRSTNNGLTFTLMENGIPSGTGGFAIKAIGSNVFVGNGAGIYFSNNQGSSFTNANTGLDPDPNNAVQGIAANSTYLFAGLYHDGVWKRPLSDFGISSSPILRDAITVNSLKIYPNPFKIQTTLEYNLSLPGEVTLWISDLSGRIVFQSSEFANTGMFSKTIDAKDFLAGIYFVQLKESGHFVTTKLIIEK